MGVKARIHQRLLERRDSPAARLALELLSSAVQSTRARQPCRMRLDGPRWIHSFRDGAIVTPVSQPDIRPPAVISAQMRDEYCHAYLPRSGDVVIDVGAGIGEALLLFSALVGTTGKVIAVEAHPLIYGCLERSIEVNHLSNVQAVHAAVTGEPGVVTLTDRVDFASPDADSSDEVQTAGWYANTIVDRQSEGTLEVVGRTLDQITSSAGVDRVGLLKMNIEGAERQALAGMGQTIAGCRAAAISCHDFIAPAEGNGAFRTKGAVRDFMKSSGLFVKTRDDNPDPAVRDIVYGVREDA